MKVLVVAFDGLDYELIKDFELDNIIQKDFGRIENSEGISAIKTSELFASFITGTTYEEHGIKGLKRFDNPRNKYILDILTPERFQRNYRGFTRFNKALKGLLDAEKRKHTKEDLKVETMFEKVDNSRAMFVPSYNPTIFWRTDADMGVPLRFNYGCSDISEYYDSREYSYRKKMLLKELDSDIIQARDLLMCHFHRPDHYNHFHGDKEIENFDRSKLLKIYGEIDELARNIKEKALHKGYDYVIFMSDHGLPTKNEHNKNAFYSCNKQIFDSKRPRITDFYDLILQATRE